MSKCTTLKILLIIKLWNWKKSPCLGNKKVCYSSFHLDGLNCLRIEIASPIYLVLPELPITCIDLDPRSTCLWYKIPPGWPASLPWWGKKILKRAEAGNCIGFKMEIFQIWKEGKLLSPLSLPTGRILYLKENCNVIRLEVKVKASSESW